MNAIHETWQANSELMFHGNGETCPASTSQDTIPVTLQYEEECDPVPNNSGSRWGWGWSSPGRGARRNGTCEDCCSDCQIIMHFGPGRWKYKTIAVHEMGHAIGFGHDRACTGLMGCNDAVTGVWTSFTSDFNADCDPNVTWISPEHDLESIMLDANYCSLSRYDPNTDYYHLSPADARDVWVRYPAQDRQRLASGSGYQTGRGLLVRSDSSVTVDWIGAGASTAAFQTIPTWTVNQGAISTAEYSISASQLPSQSTVKAEYLDTWGRTNTCTQTVIVNDAEHTALTLVALGM